MDKAFLLTSAHICGPITTPMSLGEYRDFLSLMIIPISNCGPRPNNVQFLCKQNRCPTVSLENIPFGLVLSQRCLILRYSVVLHMHIYRIKSVSNWMKRKILIGYDEKSKAYKLYDRTYILVLTGKWRSHVVLEYYGGVVEWREKRRGVNNN